MSLIFADNFTSVSKLLLHYLKHPWVWWVYSAGRGGTSQFPLDLPMMTVPTGPFKVVKCITIISTYINWIKNLSSSDKILNTPTATEGVLKICSEQRMSENRWLIWWAKIARFKLIKILWSWKRSQFNFFFTSIKHRSRFGRKTFHRV